MGIMDGAKDKAREFLSSEENSDKLLDRGERLATDRLGEDKAEHIAKARQAADERIGDGDQPNPEQQADPGDLADPNQAGPDTPNA